MKESDLRIKTEQEKEQEEWGGKYKLMIAKFEDQLSEEKAAVLEEYGNPGTPENYYHTNETYYKLNMTKKEIRDEEYKRITDAQNAPSQIDVPDSVKKYDIGDKTPAHNHTEPEVETKPAKSSSGSGSGSKPSESKSGEEKPTTDEPNKPKTDEYVPPEIGNLKPDGPKEVTLAHTNKTTESNGHNLQTEKQIAKLKATGYTDKPLTPPVTVSPEKNKL